MLSVILVYMLMILLSALNVMRHLNCGNKQNWLLNLNLIYETLWTCAGNGLLISMLKKLNWFRLTSLITLVLLMYVKMDGSVMKEKSSLGMLGLTFSSNLDWGCLSLLLKLPLRKLEPWFLLWNFFLPRLLCISINLPCTRLLVDVVATWNYWISCKNKYVELLVLHLLPLLSPWIIVEM